MQRLNRTVGPERHHEDIRRMRMTAVGLLITFSVAVTVITFWPARPNLDGQRALQGFLFESYKRGLPTWISFRGLEFAANVVMLVPIGLFGALALPRHRWVVVPLALAASSTIELFQSSQLTQRDGTPRDVLANTVGALIGYLLALLVMKVVRQRIRKRGRPQSPTAPVEAEPDATSPVGPAPVDQSPVPATPERSDSLMDRQPVDPVGRSDDQTDE